MKKQFTRTEDLITKQAIDLTRLILDLQYETDPREKELNTDEENLLKAANRLLRNSNSEDILRYYMREDSLDDLIEVSFKTTGGERFTDIKILKNLKYFGNENYINVYVNHLSSDVYDNEGEEFICIGNYEIELILKLDKELNEF